MATTTPRRPGDTATSPTQTGPHVIDVRSPAAIWWRVYRHHLRLLRNGAIAWTVALAGIGAGVIATFDDRHGSEAELQALREMEGIPAFEALLGRFIEPATVEGLTLSRWGLFAVFIAIWAMLATARLLRGAEEAGHVEPLRAGRIGPRALQLSVLAALLTTHLAFGLVVGLSHSAAGMDPATSWAVGGAMALLAASVAAGTALASQLAASRRKAVGFVGAVLGLALGLRAVAAASGTPDWVWWTTPFGWTGFLHEADAARGWVFLAFGLLLLVLLAAVIPLAHRDLHAGRFASSGSDTVVRARPVRSQVALAWHLNAAPARTWIVIIGLVSLVFGLLARDFGDAIGEMPTTVELLAQMGYVGIDTVDGVIAWAFSIVGLLLAVFAAGQVTAIRDEEASWRIEHLLVRPVGRIGWLVTRLLTALAAVLAVALAAAVAAWLGTAIVGTPVALTDAVLASANVVPLAWLTLGLGIALVAIAPRLTAPLTYGLVLAAYLLDFVGGLLELPEAVLDLSPFRQLATVPVEDIAVGPMLVMLAVGIVAATLGALVFSRRDLKEA